MRSADLKKVYDVWEAKNKIFEPDFKAPVLDFVDQIASLFSPGDFYYYILNFATYKMEFVSEGVKNVLNIDPDEFSVDRFFSLMHPKDMEDLHKKERASVNFKLEKIPVEDMTKYKTVYLMRLRLDDGSEKTILHQSKTISISKDGKIQQTMGIHTDVTHFNIINDHKVSFIGFKRPNYYYDEKNDTFNLTPHIDSVYTKREKQILKEISKGKCLNNIAETLKISAHTINTHRKNILKKNECKNMAELITTCIREGTI
ncbi:LuxR C-terminal-related transcriptional regulator [Algibacter sp. 2305UL17-15]|uniref:LuxR C-terminal-related transcriptional regulator n=1 Tax=Algibacter sp. 2305UL17-15 TaxID=3231268 RepID=UPI0034573E71